ncbi:hypothetical protein L209DRAFT_280497 [Thermothelomyces heterothallicus CBS 203.75]
MPAVSAASWSRSPIVTARSGKNKTLLPITVQRIENAGATPTSKELPTTFEASRSRCWSRRTSPRKSWPRPTTIPKPTSIDQEKTEVEDDQDQERRTRTLPGRCAWPLW